MPSWLIGALTLVVVAIWAKPGMPQYLNQTDVSGKYQRAGSASVVMEVRQDVNGVRATVYGGGPPSSGEAAAADCIVEAVGVIRDGQLRATFQPAETDNFSYSRAKAEAEKRQLVVVFSPGTADIKRIDTFGYCGLGINFLGRYNKATHR